MSAWDLKSIADVNDDAVFTIKDVIAVMVTKGVVGEINDTPEIKIDDVEVYTT